RAAESRFNRSDYGSTGSSQIFIRKSSLYDGLYSFQTSSGRTAELRIYGKKGIIDDCERTGWRQRANYPMELSNESNVYENCQCTCSGKYNGPKTSRNNAVCCADTCQTILSFGTC